MIKFNRDNLVIQSQGRVDNLNQCGEDMTEK